MPAAGVNSHLKMQCRAKLAAGVLRELLPEFALAFGVLPMRPIKPVVIPPALGGQPYFMQWFL